MRLRRINGNTAGFLLDTKSGVNFIKEHRITTTTTLTTPHTILSGNDRHDLNRTTQFNLFNEDRTFLVISSDFPLIEDGIIGLPFLKQYQYQINDSLLLDNQELPLQTTPVQLELKPGARVTRSKSKEMKLLAFISSILVNKTIQIVKSTLSNRTSHAFKTSFQN